MMIIEDYEAIAKRLETIRREENDVMIEDQQRADEPELGDDEPPFSSDTIIWSWNICNII